MKPRALLFDVGDVLLEHNWRQLEMLCAKRGAGTVPTGARDPSQDPDWQRYERGEISNDDYWDNVAVRFGMDDRIALWGTMARELQGDLFAADSLELADVARAHGVLVGILSNDMVRSSGRAWVDSRPEFARFDAIVDCTEFGVRKPAPEPYLGAAKALGVAPEDIVFLDDMAYCVEGARAVGMVALQVDPLHRHVAFDEARLLLDLPPRSQAA